VRLSYKGRLFSVNPMPVGRSVWIRTGGGRNCSRRASVRLGIDMLIANVLVDIDTYGPGLDLTSDGLGRIVLQTVDQCLSLC